MESMSRIGEKKKKTAYVGEKLKLHLVYLRSGEKYKITRQR